MNDLETREDIHQLCTHGSISEVLKYLSIDSKISPLYYIVVMANVVLDR